MPQRFEKKKKKKDSSCRVGIRGHDEVFGWLLGHSMIIALQLCFVFISLNAVALHTAVCSVLDLIMERWEGVMDLQST